MESLRIALLLHSPALGGAQRRTLQLASALTRGGMKVEIAVARAQGALSGEVDPSVRLVELGTLPWPAGRRVEMAAAIPALAGWLRRSRPDILLAAANHVHLAAIAAHRLGRPTGTRLVLRASNPLAGGGRGRPLDDWLKRRALALYSQADAIVAVSSAIAAELDALAPEAARKCVILPNPVVDDTFPARMAAAPPHPWLAPGHAVPVVLGAGRLERQKDFATLLECVARLGARRPVRAIVLGEGSERPRLAALAERLGIAADIVMPGSVPDALPWMARADAFALTSRWEGMPGVLIEALACGCPSVAAASAGAAAEILEGGRLGPVVPAGDAHALASALEDLLDRPPDPAALRRRAADFGARQSAGLYAELFTRLAAGAPPRPTTG